MLPAELDAAGIAEWVWRNGLRIKQFFTGVVGVAGVCLFGSLPAKATARLQTWQFDTGQNRFMFTTEGGVQPQVSLLHNPNRLVIDLPGIVIDEAVGNQFIGSAVQAVKIMQADARTTRMVLELDPNYHLDPQQVKVWGLTDAQWVVQLPSAAQAKARASETRPAAKATPARELTSGLTRSPLPPLLSLNQVSYAPVSPTATVIQGVQTTTTGFFVPTAGATPQIQIYRTRDANQMRQMVIDVVNAAIPPQLTPETLPHHRYGIYRWAVTQFSTLPPAVRLTLTLDAVSPDWQVTLVNGGIIMTPVGVAAHQIAVAPTTVVLPVIPGASVTNSPQAIYPGAAPPTSAQATPPGQIPNLEQLVVMLDPGHGGVDPGAVGIGGLQEKGVVLAVAHQVAAILQSQGITVQMTRQGDQSVDLQPRVDMAAAANATVFVSIHANAVNMQRPEVNGLETYYFSDSGLGLATVLHRRVLASLPTNDRGVRQARFFVLRRTTMPAALIEIGFVTGATDAPKLRDPQWQAQMGQAIAQGILDYLSGRP
ncbi:MAG: N-acetylmuramoyl-L-alanine amidase [Leptolyngbyaceae cyanobacterium SM2_5_2]|nr:N-acetylmuramoyl-L-alanine amidase [Leptolyngbyaceae cyanobacterium SM2_5_2]